jgi:membrane protein DedA with SNARE-associated domain
LVHWGYLALFLLTALSAFCIPVGSELAMAYGGALASGQVLRGPHDHFSLGLVIVVAIAGEMVGSVAGYSLGRFGGRPLVDRVGKYILLTHRDLDRVEAFMARRGDPFVLFGRLVPLLRSFVSLAGGLAEMSIVRFLAFSVVGAAVFTSALCSIGYALGASWHKALSDFSDVGYVAGALAVVAVVLAIAHRFRAVRAEKALGHHAAADGAVGREDLTADGVADR